MNTIMALQNTSKNEEIKIYFVKIFELYKSGKQFPVNLDDVWSFVYGTKHDATIALKKDFIEDIDYQFFRQNPENSLRGRPKNYYQISVPCLEFFIARKVRPIFEVYRQVFHKAAEQELADYYSQIPKLMNEIECLQSKIDKHQNDIKLLKYKYVIEGLKEQLGVDNFDVYITTVASTIHCPHCSKDIVVEFKKKGK